MNITTFLAIIIFAQTTYLSVKQARFTSPLKKNLRGAAFVDTSVLIDGRIIDVVKTGFIPNHVVIPSSVTRELQLLADGADHDKRTRARNGLDAVKHLQEIAPKSVSLFADGKFENGVDEQLLTLAKRYNGSIITIDFNLNKVAVTESIPVLNLNELAQQIRVNYLPGEVISVELTQKGSDAHQAVGYLDDGTMVVVEHANKDIGKTVDIELIRNLQTAAGRMIFAKKSAATSSAKSHVKQRKQPYQSNKTAKSKTAKNSEDRFLSLIDKQ